LLFENLAKNPSSSYKLGFVRFYHLVSARTDAGLGADFFIDYANKVQPDIFATTYLKTILPISESSLSTIDRKLAVVSFAKSIAESRAFSQTDTAAWKQTCETMLKLASLPETPSRVEDEDDDIASHADPEVIPSLGINFTTLSSCKHPPIDRLAEIQNVPQWLAKYLQQHKPQEEAVVNYMAGLPEQIKQALLTCMGV
jgi:exportin-2 (importin alpha re-exporter)